jgi:hypothetical protein
MVSQRLLRASHHQITELPVGTWTSDYKGGLRTGRQGRLARDIKSYCTDTDVTLHAQVRFLRRRRCWTWIRGKLVTSWNMRLAICTLWRRRQRQRYAGVDEIFTDHATVRILDVHGSQGAPVGRNWADRQQGRRVRASPQQVVASALALRCLGRAKAELEAALEESAYLRGRRL